MGFTTNQSSSLGDLPDNVVEVIKGLGVDPEEMRGVPTPDIPDGSTVVTSGGKEHITNEGLVDMAHEDGLYLTYSEPVQIPPPDKQKEGEPHIFRAVVATRRGVFTAYGDASKSDTMVDAICRMAETRAVNRALRQAVNAGGATFEEMPDADAGGDMVVE